MTPERRLRLFVDEPLEALRPFGRRRNRNVSQRCRERAIGIEVVHDGPGRSLIGVALGR
jgi:hypothetical protein